MKPAVDESGDLIHPCRRRIFTDEALFKKWVADPQAETCRQKFLHPGKTAGARPPTDKLPGDYKKRTEDVAHLPNCYEWWPGDLLLSCPIEPDSFAVKTWKSQVAFKSAWRHARWTHALIYIGDWKVVHAEVKPGVAIDRMADLIGIGKGHLVRVRRPRFPAGTTTDLARAFGVQIAENAKGMLGRAYDLKWAYALITAAEGGKRKIQRAEPSREDYPQICSTLYVDAYTKVALGGDKRLSAVRVKDLPPDSLPAELSKTLSLKDVEICWVKIN